VVVVVEDVELKELWRRYKETGNKELRDQLLTAYAPLVVFVASKVAIGLPSSVERCDLTSYGTFGLMDAIEKFELERNLKFSTYAVRRIKGAILDELRAIDWVPRSLRAKARAIEQASSDLEGKLRRSPTRQEIADSLEMEHSELRSLLAKTSVLGMAALDEVVLGGDSERMTLGDTIADSKSSAHGSFDQHESRRMLAHAINKLADREKLVLALYYYEDFSLAEIGKILGVTESRACQIHAKATDRLREKLGSID
jgi:RNA polymerase sigma factor for flagellar operon FliA